MLLAENETDDVDFAMIFLWTSGIECDSIIQSATYGRILNITLSSIDTMGTLPTSIGKF